EFRRVLFRSMFLFERVDDVEREIKNIERRAAVPLRELKVLLRSGEEDSKIGQAARKQLKKMGFSDEEVAEIGRIIAAAPRKVKRVEEEAMLPMDELKKSFDAIIAGQARTIRIPVHMIETINKLIRTSRYLVQEIGREPTPEEIAEKMELPLDKVRKVLKIAKEPISLETPIGEEEDSHLGDFIEDKAITSPSDAVINMNLAEQTRKVLATLTPREEKVLRMRFGIGEKSDHTLEEVGQDFEVTRERIRQIEAKALRKLRHPTRSKRLRSFVEN